jgi:hypothetical protein
MGGQGKKTFFTSIVEAFNDVKLTFFEEVGDRFGLCGSDLDASLPPPGAAR